MSTRGSVEQPTAAAQVRVRSRRPARLASIVVEELARDIIGAALPAGSPLPAEDVLCQRFGFSRTVIREGLKVLEERGLIRVEQGRGTTIQPRESWNLLDPDVLRIALEYDHDMVLLDDLIALRRLLEGTMVFAAATRMSQEELAALELNIDRMALAMHDDYRQFEQHDAAFHGMLMTASRSEIGRMVVRAFRQYTSKHPVLSRPCSPEEMRRTVAEHRAIHEALANRDAGLASDRMMAHIDVSWSEKRSRSDVATD